jgi:DNA helicase-2/ATP-dependent DNA helicase PcrA
MEYRHYTPLKNGYKTLDGFSQLLFLFEHLDKICRNGAINVFKNRWGTEWQVAKGLQGYFDKITEELVDVDHLLAANRPFIRLLADAYNMYRKVLMHENCVSFAALQKIAYNLLHDPKTSHQITQGIRYVFVDEYQDTNYIQEQIVLKLASTTRNLCVAGDEDQALYRFTGATVRNILEFYENTPQCKRLQLSINYRSHANIIAAYDRWMASSDWSNQDGTSFRTDKTIQPSVEREHPNYPAIFSIQGMNTNDEAEQFAEFVFSLKGQGIISDYSDVALLLSSVQPYHSEVYIDALMKKGIEASCPRARSYFKQEEVCLMVACFAQIFGYFEKEQRNLLDNEYFSEYVTNCSKKLRKDYSLPHPLYVTLQKFEAEITGPKEDQDEEPLTRPLDYFYQLLATEPFLTFGKNDHQMRNLVIFSQELSSFQNFYRCTFITHDNREQIKHNLFNVFLRFLQDKGRNEYEDTEVPFPKGNVQIMTIHQSKGLEFPVVVVGTLDKGHQGAGKVDRELQTFYHRSPFEPEKRIPHFDMMRLYYVAFSRAEKMLVLTSHKQPHTSFDTIWRDLPRWRDIRSNVLEASQIKPRPDMQVLPMRHYSFTGHIKMYETCPRQYQFFREYDFKPARSREAFFGQLVHYTIEEMHRISLKGKFGTLNEATIRETFEKTFSLLLRTDMHPIDPIRKEQAFGHIMNYFLQNREEIQSTVGTEIDVSMEMEGYILTGRIDLLMKRHGRLEVLDFKTGRRPGDGDTSDGLEDYKRQLYTYAWALEHRYGERPARLFLYWTEELRKEDALMEVHCDPEVMEQTNRLFDAVIGKIQKKDFRILVPPEPRICRGCDIQHICLTEGIIGL